PSGSTTVTATLQGSSTSTQPVTFSLSPLPAGITAGFSTASCSPTCTTTLTIAAAASVTTAGTFTVTVTGTSANTPHRTMTLTLGPTPGPVSVTASIVVGGVVVGTSVTFVVNDVTSAAVAGLKTYSVLGNLAIITANEQARNIGLRLAALRRGAGGGVSVS